MSHAKKIIVHSYDEALDAVDGKRVTLDGVSGHIKVSYPDRRFPTHAHVSHEPDARGKRSEAYLETKRELHDDWSTDLTHSERLVDIMTDLGIVFE